jgi:hypothetical protein
LIEDWKRAVLSGIDDSRRDFASRVEYVKKSLRIDLPGESSNAGITDAAGIEPIEKRDAVVTMKGAYASYSL